MLLREMFGPRGVSHVRFRLRIMTLYVGSLSCSKELAECFVIAQGPHVVVVTESNIIEAMLAPPEAGRFALTNYCWSRYGKRRGGY